MNCPCPQVAWWCSIPRCGCNSGHTRRKHSRGVQNWSCQFHPVSWRRCLESRKKLEVVFTYPVKLVLMALQAGLCARCRRPLIEQATADARPYVIGEAAHNVGSSPLATRGDSPLTVDERNEIDNAVYLCAICHKLVDKDKKSFPDDVVSRMRQEHLDWVRIQLEFDANAGEWKAYKLIVDEWTKRVPLDYWKGWTGCLLSDGAPYLINSTFEALGSLNSWLFALNLPGKRDELDMALSNFTHVLRDFMTFFGAHSELDNNGAWYFSKIPKPHPFNLRRDHQVGLQNEFNHTLLEDLVMELTRAANLVCDVIREKIDPLFRVSAGALTVVRGPAESEDGSDYKEWKPEYEGDERKSKPYLGIEDFKTKRKSRDFCVTSGKSWKDPQFLEGYPQYHAALDESAD